MFHRDNGLVPHAAAVREGEREGLHGSVEGTPDVDYADATGQEGVCFGGGGDVVPHAGFGGGFGLVDVDPLDGVAGCGWVGAADGVVEEEDSSGAGDVGEEGAFDFGVVALFDGDVGGEVYGRGGRGWGGAEGGEGVGVEGEGLVAGGVVAEVVDLDGDGSVGEVALGLAFWRLLDVVEGFGAVGWGFVEGEVGGYGAAGDVAAVIVLSGDFGDLGLDGGCGGGHGRFEYLGDEWVEL